MIFTEQRQLNDGWNLSLGYKPEDIRIQGFCNVSAVNCYFVPKTFSNNYITIFKNIIKGFHDNLFHMLFNYNPANLCHSYLFSYFNVLTVLLWFYKLVTLYQAPGTFGQNTGQMVLVPSLIYNHQLKFKKCFWEKVGAPGKKQVLPLNL